jgi:hypothetical protein
MKVLIAVDPDKASVAVAAVDGGKGEVLERAGFPQNRASLRALECWPKRFPERRSGQWKTPAVSAGTWRGVGGNRGGESDVDVPLRLSAPVRVLSSGNARKNDGLDALATAVAASCNERLTAVDPEAASEVLRLPSERREDLAAGRTRALKAASTDSCEASCPTG